MILRHQAQRDFTDRNRRELGHHTHPHANWPNKKSQKEDLIPLCSIHPAELELELELELI